MNKLLLPLFAGAALTAVADPWNAYWIGPDAGGSINEVSNWSYDQTSPLEADKFLHLPEGGGIGSRLFTVDSPMSILGFAFTAPEDVKTKVYLNAPLEFTQGNDMNRDVTATTNSFEVDFGTSKAIVQGEYDKKLYMPGTWTMNEGSLLELTSLSPGARLQFEVVGALHQQKSEVRWFWNLDKGVNTAVRKFVVDEGAEWTMDAASATFTAYDPQGRWEINPGWGGWLDDCENNGLLELKNASTNTLSSLINTGCLKLSDASFLGALGGTQPRVCNDGDFIVSGLGNAVWGGGDSSTVYGRIENDGRILVGADGEPAELIVRAGSSIVSNGENGVIALYPGSRLKIDYAAPDGVGFLTTFGVITQRQAEVVFDWTSPGNNGVNRDVPYIRGWKVGKTGFWTIADSSICYPTSSVKPDVWVFDTSVNDGRLEVLNRSRLNFFQIQNNGTMTLAGESSAGYPPLNNEHIFVNAGTLIVSDGENCFGVRENSYDHEVKVSFSQRRRAALEGEAESDVPSPSLRIGTNDTDMASLLLRAGHGYAFCDFYDGMVDIGRAGTLEVSTWMLGNYNSKHAKVRNYGATVRHAGAVRFRPCWSGNWDRNDGNETECHLENAGDWCFDGGEGGAVLGIEMCNFGNAVKNMTVLSTGRLGGSGVVRTECAYNVYFDDDIFTINNSGEFHVDNGGLELRGAKLDLKEGSTLTFNLGATPFEKGLAVTSVQVPNPENEADTPRTKGGKIIFPAGLKADIRASFADLKGWTGKHRIELVKAETSIEGGLAGVTVNGVEPDADGVVTVDGQVVRTALSHEGNAWYLDVAVPMTGMVIFIR